MTTPGPAPFSWGDVLSTLLAGGDLTSDAARWAMGEIMAGEATPVQVAGFLIGLRAKGETIGEVRALADTMLAHAVRIEVPGPSLDIVGTGGDRAHTVNISTMSAVVAAGCGVRIVKHGNRAASSASGSADVLEALGVDLSLPPGRVGAWLNVVNTRDPIPWNRGAGERFPDAVDAFITDGRLPVGPGGAHDPATYTGSDLVAAAVIAAAARRPLTSAP